LTVKRSIRLLGRGFTVRTFISSVLGVHPSVPVNGIAEMAAYAKANPTKWVSGS
jgi:hypothetical protein